MRLCKMVKKKLIGHSLMISGYDMNWSIFIISYLILSCQGGLDSVKYYIRSLSKFFPFRLENQNLSSLIFLSNLDFGK